MNSTDELAQLKNEVAQLKAQLAELQRFLTIEESEKIPGRKNLNISCSSVHLRDPDGESQGFISAGDKGAEIALWGDDQKLRVHLSAEKEGRITLYQSGLKQAVDISIDEKGHPYVATFDGGKPRAIIKSNEKGGVVSVVHDDGNSRAFMLSESQCGEFIAVDADMRAAVKISSNGQEGGGYLTVNHPNGKPGVILATTRITGAVILNDSHGKQFATLPDPKNLGGNGE